MQGGVAEKTLLIRAVCRWCRVRGWCRLGSSIWERDSPSKNDRKTGEGGWNNPFDSSDCATHGFRLHKQSSILFLRRRYRSSYHCNPSMLYRAYPVTSRMHDKHCSIYFISVKNRGVFNIQIRSLPKGCANATLPTLKKLGHAELTVVVN